MVFKQLIPTLNGCWALYIRWSSGRSIGAVDRSRSIPLFYTKAGPLYSLGDTPERSNAQMSLSVDGVSAAAFLLSGYISGSSTLFAGVHQVEAGTWVEFGPSAGAAPCVGRYFRCFSDEPRSDSHDVLERDFQQTIEDVSERIGKALSGHRLILPLSGGFDSRLIGWMLWKNGLRDVLCYTYGTASNPQVKLASDVANAFGFRWRFIEYTPQRWAEWMASQQMMEYWDFACGGTSCPHIQDFPAVAELHRLGELYEAPIFLPGHVGDAWAGLFASPRLDTGADHPPCEYHSRYRPIVNPVVSAIIYRHLNLWPTSVEAWRRPPLSGVAERLHDEIADLNNSREGGHSAYVDWVLQSRTANWIVNSCRLFEFFGGEFALCLGDYSLIDFFRRVPSAELFNCGLYARTLQNRLFDCPRSPIANIPVISGGVPSFTTKQMAIRMLVALGLYKSIDRWRFRSFRNRSLAADCWFTGGRSSSEVTIGQALDRYEVMEFLPDELRSIVYPYVNRPVYSVQCNGLLAAVVLARAYARYGRRPIC